MRALSALLSQSCSDNLLAWVTLFYIAGGSSAYLLRPGIPAALLPPFGLTLLGLLAVASVLSPPRHRLLFSLALFFLLGFTHTLTALHQPLAHDHIANHIHQKTRATLVGTISSFPEYDGQRCRFTLDVRRLMLLDPADGSEFEPVHGRVRLSVREKLPAEYTPGMDIMTIVTIDRVHTFQTPGVFDYQLYMAGRSIYCSGWMNAGQNLYLIGKAAWPGRIRYLPEQIRHATGLYLEQNMARPVADIYKALLIGSRATVPPEVQQRFVACGIMHLLAISGLHLSLLALLSALAWLALLKRSQWLLLNSHVPSLALVLTSPLLVAYACIAGLQPPVLRALVMALFTLFAVLIRRQHTLIPILSAAALILLIANPLLLFTASFQLSFSAVLAIAITCQWFAATASLNTEQAPVMHKWAKQGVAMVMISLAATLGTLPFMLFHFNRISLVGPLMNLVVEPILCLWSLPLGLLAVPCIYLFPDAAVLLLQAGGWGISLVESITKTTAVLPFCAVWTITPHPVEVAAFLLLLGFMACCRVTWKKKATLSIIAGTALLASFTSDLWLQRGRLTTTATVLDVGQGLSILIELPDGKKILVDGGGRKSNSFDPGERVIAPFLWKKRIWRLDDIIISHPHSDHYNGLPFIHRHFKPNRLIINGQQETDWAYAVLLRQAKEKGTRVLVASAGDILQGGGEYRVTCLGTPGLEGRSGSLSANDQSIVLLLEHGRRRILLPGDAGIPAEKLLLDSGQLLKADVLVAGHHGSSSSSSPRFLKTVAPKYIVVSASRTAIGRLPSPRHLQTWSDEGIPTFTTAIDGTVSCTISTKGLQLNTYTKANL